MDKMMNIYNPVLTIGTVAKQLDIAVQTVRLYEQEGLVLPHKTETGRRMYSMHDLERLHCVRRMITEYGMNLQGIKRIMSLLPCWEYKGGLDDQCRSCSSYYEAAGPCWNNPDVAEKCQNQNCRECPVYAVEFNCQTMKQVIYGHKREKELA